MDIPKKLHPICSTIGEHLHDARRHQFPRDDQRAFARRLGVSRETLRKMERGDPGVAFGRYLQAAELLGCAEAFRSLFELEKDLFEQAGM